MVRIITDSTSGLDADLAKRYQLHILPYYAHVEGETVVEDLDFDRRAYFRRMRSAKELPTTSHPNLADIVGLYQKLLDEPSDPIVHLVISSKWTTTYELALKAKEEFPQAHIELYDTLVAVAPQALLAIEAARAAQNGANIEEVMATLQRVKERMDNVLVVDTLTYLARGGRIGRAQALLGNMLSMKPLLAFRDGIVTPVGRVRTHQQAIRFVLNRIGEDMKRLGGSTLRAVVEDSDNEEQANQMIEALRKDFPVEEVFHIATSIVSGTHIGPGAWGLAYFIT